MNKKGFTLIELLAAITILGMLMVITIPAVENLMARNRTKKYKAYAEAIERAAKLYMDSYGENAMVDNSNYFCIKLTYDTLKDRKLLKDFQGDESCEDDNTFVYVEKNTNTADGKGYKYDRSVRCTKNNKEVYREDVEGRTGSCTKVDSMGGIQVSATGFDKWYQTINAPDITITIKDLNTGQGTGFGANTSIRYQWVKNGSSPDKTKWLTLDMGNATQTSSLSKKINRSTGNYPSGVEGTGEWNLYIYGICDTVGHCSKTQKFGLYKFDNIPPSCEVKTELASGGSYSPTYSGSNSWNKAGSAYTNGKWTYRDVKTSIGSRSDTVNKSVQSDLTSSTVDRITVKQKVKDKNRNWQDAVTLKNHVIGNSYEVSSSGITTVTYYLKDNVGLEGSCTQTINVDKEKPASPSITMYKTESKDYDYAYANPGKGGYTAGDWYKHYVYTTMIRPAPKTEHEYSGTHYYTTASGAATDEGEKEQEFRNVFKEGTSQVHYKACTKAGLCSNTVDSGNIKLDRSAPTGMQIVKKVKTDCSTNWEGGNHDSATNYSSGSWTKHCTWSKAYGAKDKFDNGEIYYSDASGATSDKNEKQQTFRNINAEGTSTVYHHVCDRLGNCTNNTSYTVKLDHSGPTCSVTKTNTGTTSGVTATFTCYDKKLSGTKQCTPQKTGLKSNHSYSIEDNVGNPGTCSVTVTSKRSCTTTYKCKCKQECTSTGTKYLYKNNACSNDPSMGWHFDNSSITCGGTNGDCKYTVIKTDDITTCKTTYE